jgi:hypothetical protein
MDFLAEYDEMNKIPSKIAVTYSFFDLFKVQLKDSPERARGIHWPGATDSRLTDNVLQAFKAYIKAKKAELKLCDTKSNCGKMLWFFYQKLLEFDVFTVETRRDILSYMDICEYIIL